MKNAIHLWSLTLLTITSHCYLTTVFSYLQSTIRGRKHSSLFILPSYKHRSIEKKGINEAIYNSLNKCSAVVFFPQIALPWRWARIDSFSTFTCRRAFESFQSRTFIYISRSLNPDVILLFYCYTVCGCVQVAALFRE